MILCFWHLLFFKYRLLRCTECFCRFFLFTRMMHTWCLLSLLLLLENTIYAVLWRHNNSTDTYEHFEQMRYVTILRISCVLLFCAPYLLRPPLPPLCSIYRLFSVPSASTFCDLLINERFQTLWYWFNWLKTIVSGVKKEIV